MFGVGYQEMMLVGLAALLLFGPGKLPEVMSQAGKWYKQFRDVTSGLTDEFNKTVAEAKTEFEGAVGDLGPMQKQVDSITRSVQKDLGGKTTTTGKKSGSAGAARAKSASGSKTSKAGSKATPTKSTSTSKTTSSRTSSGSRTNQPKTSSHTTAKKVVNASKEDPYASISLFEQPERPTKRRARSATPSVLTDLTPRDLPASEERASADSSSLSPVTDLIDADDPVARARQRRLRAGYAQATG